MSVWRRSEVYLSDLVISLLARYLIRKVVGSGNSEKAIIADVIEEKSRKAERLRIRVAPRQLHHRPLNL
jgi:hypothetical protein